MLKVSLIALMAAAVAAPVLAQDRAQETSEATELGEIVVTARKRSERLQEVPESITAFDAQAIEAARIENISDAIGLTPGVTMIRDQQPGSSTIAIRGLAQNRTGEPPVAFVIDGVPLANPYEFTQDLFDIERIEVLKGPQGSLYGRNSIGGAINITTRQPGNDFEGQVKLRLAEGNDVKIGASVGGPIVRDKLFFRLSGTANDTDGVIENPTQGKAVDGFQDRNLRGKLVFTPTEDLTIALTGFWNRYEGGAGWWAASTPDFFGWVANPTTAYPQGDVLGRSEREHKSASLKADWDVGNLTLTSITGYADLQESLDQDADMSRLSVFRVDATEWFETFTQEFRLSYDGDGPVRWLLGAFYQHTDRRRLTRVNVNINAPPPIGGGNGDPAQAVIVNVAAVPNERTFDAWALFGQADWDITDKLTLTAGLRWDTEDREQPTPAGLPKANFESLQPKVSLAYQWTPDLLTYATIAKGYRPGGFNEATIFGATFKKEELWSYEAGFKSTLFDRRLTFNAAAYYQDYTDQQFFIVRGDGLQAIVNGGKSEIMGAEFELHAQPIERLQLSAGLGVNDARIRSFGTFPGVTFNTAAFADNHIPQVPTYNFTASVQYGAPIRDGLDVTGRLDWRREGEIWWHPDNVHSRGAFDIVDARISLETERLVLTLFADNLFDERYVSSYFANAWSGVPSGVDIAWVPMPRVVGVEATLKF